MVMPSRLNVGSRVPSVRYRRRTNRLSNTESGTSTLPTRTILPSGWIARSVSPIWKLKDVVRVPSFPNVRSREPLAL